MRVFSSLALSCSSSALTLCCLCVSSAAAAEHLQQRPGVHPLLPGRLLHVQAHVPEDLRGAHLLARGLVVDGRARGVALGPRAAVHQVEGAAPGGRGPGSPAAVTPVAAVDVVALLQAPVPAVEGSGQGSALHSEVNPVAAEAGGDDKAVIRGVVKNCDLVVGLVLEIGHFCSNKSLIINKYIKKIMHF